MKDVPQHTPAEQALNAQIQEILPPVLRLMETLTDEEGHQVIETFCDEMVVGGIVQFVGTKVYHDHMDKAGKNATQRPFGIDMATLSHSMRLVLYPTMVFPPIEETLALAKAEGETPRFEGPQVIVYTLDSFQNEKEKDLILSANMLFIAAMTEAIVQKRYPLVEGERSSEFVAQVLNALSIVKRFLEGLPAKDKARLPRQLRLLTLQDPATLEKHAAAFAKYQCEPMKMRGLLEFSNEETTSQQAVEKQEEFLHLTDRNLPKRPEAATDIPSPQSLWTEYTTNRFNRDHKLYGRYATGNGDGIALYVDYLLDSTHFPSKYGFFSLIEMIKIAYEDSWDHIIIGQEIRNPFDPNGVYPTVVAGNFSFWDEDTRTYLEQLMEDVGTKKEIAQVLEDVYELARQGKLQWV